MARALAFEQIPPLSAPLRFFLAAPWFLVAAGIMLLWSGPQALVTRWSPLTLALTHLVTLGFLASAMLGALIQILPVIAGVRIPRAQLTAAVVQFALSIGCALLAAAFFTSQAVLFKLALPCLALAFGWFLVAGAIGLWQARGADADITVVAIRTALLALSVTVSLGLALASAFAWPLALPLAFLTDLHAGWGMVGWTGLLMVGAALHVIPMFQSTEQYPHGFARAMVAGVPLLLLAWSATSVLGQHTGGRASMLAWLAIATAFAVFATQTLSLLRNRKRPRPDVTTLFWYAAMGSLLASAVLWLLPQAGALSMGAMFLFGFACSAVTGMLYKIVPFLLWYHLQLQGEADGRRAPNIRLFVPDEVARRQFWCHLAALLALAGATLWPDVLARVAAILILVSSAWLGVNLFAATRLYRRHRAP